MRLSPSFDPRNRRGYILVLTLVFLATSLMVLSSVMWWSSSNAKVTQQNELFTTSEAAAEAATEEVVATMDRDWTYGEYLQAASVYSALIPTQTNTWGNWPVPIQFSDGSGNNNQTGVTIATTNFYGPVGSTFANMQGYIQPCTIISSATARSQLYSVTATVQQVVNATIIPLFQFAIFYNMNLEIDPGATMPINGAVFCNAGIWAGNDNVTFNSTVAAVGLVYDNDTDPTNDDPWCSSKSDVGTSSGNFIPGMPKSGEDALTLPIGNSTNTSPSAVEALINLPPSSIGAPNPAAYTTNGLVYFFNASDLIISNSAAGVAGTKGTNITIWYQDPSSHSSIYLNHMSNDFYALKIGPVANTNVVNMTNSTAINYWTNVSYGCYTFATNVTYYDYRENDNVQAVQIDVTNLSTWLTNQSATGGYQYNKTSFSDNGHGIQSIYVYNKVQPASGNPGILPAVRLYHGFQLPHTVDPNGTGGTSSGLTVATPQPIYVYGNYNVQTNGGVALASAGTTNTANSYPASLLGDAITVLSPRWSDTYNSSTSLNLRGPTATTLNAACLEGIVQSTNSNYSGGVENFLRLEENWSATILTYNGSIVVMFPSQYATSPWPGTGSVYNAPQRNWGFDLNFTVPSKLPPLSPKFYKIVRNAWTDY